MRVVISISGEYSAMTIYKEAARAYELYIGQDANLTFEEFVEMLKLDGKIVLENENTGRAVTITRVKRVERA